MKRAIAIAFTLTVAIGATACGGGAAEPGGGDTQEVSGPSARELADAPPELASLVEQADELLPGGVPVFEERLDELRGYPVVVNKWASWCPPCRAEFPFFAAQASKRFGEVAFLGIDAQDDDASAREFLGRFPVGYPSYIDPDQEVAAVFNGAITFPTTAFYDAGGELSYVKQGGYATEELLAADIDRYAVGGDSEREE